MSAWPSQRRNVILVLLIVAMGLFLRPMLTSAVAPDPVTAAWDRARAAGGYHFTSDITQVTIPLATLTNVGRTSRTAQLHLEGRNDLWAEQMEFTLWSEGGSVLQAESGLGIRTEAGKTFARRGGGDWEVIDDFTGSMAPQGDFMSYLAAIKTVAELPGETRGGISFTRYTFEIDSPRFAAHMHRQMEATLRARGELPPTLKLDVPAYFRDMVGSGELWVGEDGLPLRQILTLQFPPQDDEQVHSQIVVDFSGFGVLSPESKVQSLPSWLADAGLRTQDFGLLYALPLMVLGACLIRLRQKRWLNVGIVSLVIFAQIVGPVLTTLINVRFFDSQTAQAAIQQERQAAANEERELRATLGTVEFNPHVSPESKVLSPEFGVQSSELSVVDSGLQTADFGRIASASLQLVDNGTDTDGDTLSDFVEERIGTSYLNADTDSDGIPDSIEVAGFLFGGQRWYTDPSSADSNGDGLGDAIEWGTTDSGLRATPLDTDGDGIPDLFDLDNDGDGVPDKKDLSPFVKGAESYGEAAPLGLTIKNLTANTPTAVEFQVRPADEKQLWFAYNVLDWPQDNEGQVRDVDGKTYADVAATAGRTAAANESNGDMKLLPMLEIRMPANSANLPAQADLIPFNISVNNFSADGQTKVAYVPLNIVTDEQTGQRVAFSGQMNYLPTGVWLEPHQVRLAWVVQALIDIQCDPKDSAQVAQGCQADGYIHNVAQPIQSYYSDWNLTGLTVREDHGASMAIAYEDPAADADFKDDAALWALSFVLDHHFLLGRDESSDGQRDLTIDDIPTRFDRDNNPTAAQRMDVPNTLQVEKQQYSTLERAVAATAMTETVKILNTVFKPVVATDRAVKPLLLFAQENTLRALTFDSLSVGDYVVQTGRSLTFDLAPASKPAVTTNVTAGLKWMGYCAPADGEVSFRPCTADEYWEELERRYGDLSPEAGETDADPAIARLMMAQLYYMGFSSGYQSTVQNGQQVLSGTFAYDGEDQTATKVRASLQALSSAPIVAGLAFGRVFQAYLGARASGMIQGYSSFMNSLSTSVQLAQSSGTGAKGAALTKALTSAAKAQRALFAARVGPMATVGAVLMVSFQIASLMPDLPPTTRTVLGTLSLALNLGLTVIMPIVEVAFFLKAGAASVMQALTQTFAITHAMRVASLVGLAISVLVIWGFFFHAMRTGELKAGDPALNRAFFEAVAATVVAVLLTILASNPIGLIIASIIGIIDLLLTLICELGVDEMRDVPGLDGACFTLTGALTKFLARLLYSYDLMIDMGRSDLMVTDAPQTTLGDPSKGYIVGNTLNVTLPVTTTARHKDPDPNNGVLIYPYMYFFSADNLKRSTFKYSMTTNGNHTPAVALDEVKDQWKNVVEDRRYLVSPMYRGQLYTVPAPLTDLPLAAGINTTVPFTLNMSFAIPAYECWTLIVIPICYIREYKDANHLPINSLLYDVFPATLDEFLAMSSKQNGGLGQSWDAKFPTLRDADGDGLISVAYNGLDPNDATPDADGDGLTDRLELEHRMNGVVISPISRDTDGDGLTDLQEILLGTNPGVADSDNDGLLDGEELYHLRYDPDTGELTSLWEGGWDVTINATTPFVVRVSSDPLSADSDGDGLSDQAERQLAQDPNPANRVDNQNRPYHPLVPNSPPLALLLATNDLDGFLAPGQSLIYTNTIIASTAVAPGVLNVTPASVLGNPLNPLALPFNPVTFTSTQTVTVPINLTVDPGSATQAAQLHSTVNTRLPNTGAAGWQFAPITTEPALGNIPSSTTPYFSEVTASRPDRQDNYLLSALSIDDIGPIGFGDILGYSLPDGGVRAIENDDNNTRAILGDYPPQLATNAIGDMLAVWGQVRYCNTITINSLRVVTAGADGGSSGIEPFIAFKPSNAVEAHIWYWQNADMTSGQQSGPNAQGFPITHTYCAGPAILTVYESDGDVNNPAQNQLVAAQTIDLYTPPANGLLTFTGAGHTIELNVTVPLLDRAVVAGSLLASNGQLKRSVDFPVSPVTTTRIRQSFGPAVASNGDGFLAAYESFSEAGVGGPYGLPQIVIQAFDRNGDPLQQASLDAGSFQVGVNQNNSLSIDVAWTGTSYRVIWQDRRTSNIYSVFAAANGQLLSAAQLLANDALVNGSRTDAPRIAYDPVSQRALVVYLAGDRTILGRVYAGATLVAGPKLVNTDLYPATRSPEVDWHPGYQGWLLSYQDNTTSQRHVFVPLDANADRAFTETTGFFIEANDNSLACPLPQSFPVVDLRFEDMPGTTAFADVSGYANNATCTGSTCPAAGVVGAPNATLSDYALRFDGVDDGLTLNRTIQDTFTIAFWLKVETSNTPQMLVDGGNPATTGFQIFLNNGALAVQVPGFNAQAGSRLDDNEWHFVAINRDLATGRVEAYVDDNGVIGVPGTAGVALNEVADLRIGKSRTNTMPLGAELDHLQIYPVVLAQDMVQAIFNRTQQSYCAAAGASVTLSDVYWAKIRVEQQDTRGGRLTVSNGLTLTIDNDLPTAQISSVQNNAIVGPDQVIGGTASDPTSGIGQVEVSVNNGPWQLASGANTWAFSLAGLTGAVNLRVRAIDAVGNVGNPSPALNVTVDNNLPTVTVASVSGTIKPTKNAQDRWQVSLNGTASDSDVGIDPGSLLVKLTQQSGVGVVQSEQQATLTGNNWSINYLLNAGLFDPTGSYTVTVSARDQLGHPATPATTVIRLDARGPDAALKQADATRTVISQTLTVGGVISDTDSIVGIDKLEIAFTPVEQIAALPAGLTGEQAEAQLNRVWTPVTLAGRGAGVSTTTWSYQIPAGLEHLYQIDLRGTDLLGNVAISANLWRGEIDTSDPRMVMTATATGASYFDTTSGQRRHAIRFLCAAQDRNLDEATFDCPGESVAVPTRSFVEIPTLQTLFPDLTIRSGLAISYTLWLPTLSPAATVRACDSLGRCAQASTAAAANAAQSLEATLTDAPHAVILAPTDGSVVSAGATVSVTVAAEAAALLRDVTIRLDGAVVQTLSFAQAEARTSMQRTLNIPVAGEGSHTLVAQATDWAGVTQTTLFPVTFVADKAAPSVTIDTSPLTVADTWQPRSGMLRFHGTAADSVGLAAVQVRVDGGDFVDATFAGGTWQTAIFVPDPEGRTLQVTVRAIDYAGRSNQVTQAIVAELSDANAPNTTITSGPANSTNVNTASFVFGGSANAAVFECQLDGGTYQLCVSPKNYANLSKGSHTFRVRAIDGRGFPDLSPAEHAWTISAGTVDATITSGPSSPTTERNATFVFTGNGATAFECSLDGSAFVACASPQQYSGLSYGEHTFEVRGRNGETVGAAASYGWTINNRAPVAASQTVTTAFGSSIVITLRANDDDPLTYKLIGQPAHGLLQGTPPTLTYTPDSGFSGVDRFTFAANDGLVDSNVATVTINVTEGGGVSTASTLYLPIVGK